MEQGLKVEDGDRLSKTIVFAKNHDHAAFIQSLERIFVEAGVDETALGALQFDGGLPRFVRGLVGLDRQAAKRAFAEFLDNRKLTADQLEFLDLIIDHLTAHGIMDPKLLYEAPFTDFDSNGVEGVFERSDVVRLVQILRDIDPRSQPDPRTLSYLGNNSDIDPTDPVTITRKGIAINSS
jgi:type I site-specific restriction endonuclease